MALIQMNSCNDCKHCGDKPDYTEDSFERPVQLFCRKSYDRTIARYVEWNDAPIPVPDWCPMRLKPKTTPVRGYR